MAKPVWSCKNAGTEIDEIATHLDTGSKDSVVHPHNDREQLYSASGLCQEHGRGTGTRQQHLVRSWKRSAPRAPEVATSRCGDEGQQLALG